VRRAAVALLLLGSSQWCFAGLFSDDEAHKKITVLEQQVRTLDARLAAAENLLSTQSKGMLDLVSQLDALKSELSRLQGQNEVYAHDIQTTQKRQRDLYVDLDGRLRKLEQGASREAAADPSAAPPSGGQGAATAAVPVVSQAAPPVANPADESKVYEAALNQFKSGNYQGAIAGFQGFVNAYPGSPLTPSAHYWIGNSHFTLRDYKSAIASQQKLMAIIPPAPRCRTPCSMWLVASWEWAIPPPRAVL
jgi:TolA-binding protein